MNTWEAIGRFLVWAFFWTVVTTLGAVLIDWRGEWSNYMHDLYEVILGILIARYFIFRERLQ